MTTPLGVMDEASLERSAFRPEEACFGSLETPRGHLPLAAMDVAAQITGLDFTTRVSQRFRNVFEEPLEATYIFPLPDRAAVHGFRMRVAGRVVEGELQERGEARRHYDEALERGHRAAIAEEERAGVFTMRVGNIPPGESVEVELELTGPLSVSDGEATWRFPLVVAPRYIPGTPLDGEPVGAGTSPDTDAVPDASRISPPVLLPGQPNPVRLGLTVELDPAGLPIAQVASSLHQLHLEELGEGRRRIWLPPGTERLDRDFLLRFRVGEEGLRTGLLLHREGDEEEATFSLTVVPPTLTESGTPPRDVLVVLDRSGSMGGWKMVAARRAAGRLIDTLTEHDRFGVILFDDRLEEPTLEGRKGGLFKASDRLRFRAGEFLAGVEARGGTEMGLALDRALASFDAPSAQGRERIVVFVTDGQVGNEDQLLWQVRKQARGVRVFAIGVDRAVNEAFLKRLSQPTGGAYELVESEDRLDSVMRAMYRRIGRPVLTELRLEGGDVEVLAGTLAPEGAADVFPGVPARLTGRLRGRPREKLTLVGLLPGGERFTRALAAVATTAPAVPRTWARARVLDLEHRYVTSGERDRTLADEITAFSLRHGVLSRFTAFVAVDRQEVVNEGGQGHRVTQPVEPASGWAMLEGAPGGIPAGAAGPVTGAPARPCAMPAPAPCAPMASGGAMLSSASKTRARKKGRAPSLVSKLSGVLSEAMDSVRGALGGTDEECSMRLDSFDAPAGGEFLCDDLDGLGDGGLVPRPGSWQAEFLAAVGEAWRALIDQALALLREARDEAGIREGLAFLLTDLEVLLEELGKAPGSLAGVRTRLEGIHERLSRLPEADRTRGSRALGETLAELEAVDAELHEGGRRATGKPEQPAVRRPDFWR